MLKNLNLGINHHKNHRHPNFRSGFSRKREWIGYGFYAPLDSPRAEVFYYSPQMRRHLSSGVEVGRLLRLTLISNI